MKKVTTFLGIACLSVGLLTACGGENVEPNNQANEETNEEVNQTDLGAISEIGNVTIVKEFNDYTLEGNESVAYQLSDIKIIELSDYSEWGKTELEWQGFDPENLPDSLYVLSAKETKKNNTDESIEFAGIITAALGTEQIEIIENDFVSAEDDASGSTMMAGTEAKEEIGFIIENPEVDSIKFVLSSAFDSETFETDYQEETTFKVTVK